MNVDYGPLVDTELSSRRIPSTNFSAAVEVTTEAYVKVSSCRVVRKGSLDLLSVWNDPISQIRKLGLSLGETVILIPTGQGVVYSQYPVIPSAIVNTIAGGAPVQQLPVDVPVQLTGGLIATDYYRAGSSNPNGRIPFPYPWLTKLGAMTWNTTIDPTLDSKILDNRLVYNTAMPVGVRGTTDAGALAISTATPSVQRLISGTGTMNGINLADATHDLSRPFFVNLAVPGLTLYPDCLLVGFMEIVGSFLAADRFRATGGGIGGIVLASAILTLYTMFPRLRMNEENNSLTFVLFAPNWKLEAGHVLRFFYAVDQTTGAMSDRYSAGYAPRALMGISTGAISYSSPVLASTPVAPSNLQPL
jgi:hypothetical protein